MCAEELTNQVLFMRNVPAGDRDIWMTFEAVEDGELGERGRGWGSCLWEVGGASE